MLVLVLVLVADSSALAQGAPPTPTAAPTPPTRSASIGTTDYPDISSYLGREEELIARATAARATVTAQIEAARQRNASREEFESLKRRDEELERVVTALRGIAAFATELRDLQAWRERIDATARDLASKDEELRKERLDPKPAVAAADKVAAENRLEALARERETLKARIRTVPKLVDERRAERTKRLLELAAIDPNAPRGSAESARRWGLRVVLAYLDRLTPFLVERQGVWERRLALIAQETDYWESRRRFIENVLSGRHEKRVEIYRRLEEVGRRSDEIAVQAALIETNSPKQKALLDELRELGHQKFLARQQFEALEEQERVEAAEGEKRGLKEKLDALDKLRGQELGEVRGELERARKEAEAVRAEAAKHQADLEAQRKRFQEEIAAAQAELAALEGKPDAGAEEKARIETLRARVDELRQQEARSLDVEQRLLRAEEEKAELAEKLAQQSANLLARAEERSSLLLRQDQELTVAALRQAVERAAADARALEEAVAAGEPFRGRKPWYALVVAIAAALAIAVYVRVGRALDGLGRGDA